MQIDELREKLLEKRIPLEMYSLLKGGTPNEQYCIIRSCGHWEIYYSEHGRKTGIKIFKKEEDACIYFYKKILQNL